MPSPGWYYRLSSFFKEKFGEKVFKIPLDAGFSCPNRDGSISNEGCIYCYNPSFSPGALLREKEGALSSIKEQILCFQQKGEQLQGRRAQPFSPDFKPRRKYLAYFQSYSNTYAPVSRLKQIYGEALEMPGIVGLSIATRPDCLTPQVLELLAGYAETFHIWLELGLQSSYDRTLKYINRGHTYKDFEKAILQSRDTGVFLCAHIINGLPGESRAEMLETARRVSSLPLHGIKFHQLQVFRNTPLGALYEQGHISLLSMEEYLEVICDQLELLRGSIVVHRLLSEATSSALLLSPDWGMQRSSFSQLIEKELKSRGSWQGKSAENVFAYRERMGENELRFKKRSITDV